MQYIPLLAQDEITWSTFFGIFSIIATIVLCTVYLTNRLNTLQTNMNKIESNADEKLRASEEAERKAREQFRKDIKHEIGEQIGQQIKPVMAWVGEQQTMNRDTHTMMGKLDERTVALDTRFRAIEDQLIGAGFSMRVGDNRGKVEP